MKRIRINGLGIYVGIILSLMCTLSVCCRQLYRNGTIVWNRGTILAVIAGIIISFSVGIFLCSGLIKTDKFSQWIRNKSTLKKGEKYLVWGIIFSLWIPGFLAYCPGICAYDIEGTFYQFINGAYNNQHPLIFTLMIKALYYFGIKVFHSTSAGLIILSFIQMLLLSFAFSVVVWILSRYINRLICIILVFFFGIYPFNMYMSLSITKDTIFAAVFLLTICSIFEYLQNEQKSRLGIWGTIIFGVLTILFRSNAQYVVILMVPVSLLFGFIVKRNKKKFLLLALWIAISAVIGSLSLAGLNKVTNTQTVDKREMFSLPMQQIARAVNLHKDELSADEIADAETLIWASSLYSYDPYISDPVKSNFISWEILHRPLKWIKFYFKLFKRYPKDYFDAVICLYSGFIDPLDESHLYINRLLSEDGLTVPDGYHYIQTVHVLDRFNIAQKPILTGLHAFYEWFANSDIYSKIPIISLLFAPGVIVWINLILIGISVKRHNSKAIFINVFVMMLFATYFLGPTVQLRYIFPVMICLPIQILMTFLHRTT